MALANILIVDDDPTIRNCLADFLKEAGFQVIQAEGADEAILIATQSPPDLILSDVILKGVDGIALCRKIKTDSRTTSIPLILMSGIKTEGDDQVNGLAIGADDYLIKPFEGKLLVAKVQAVLRRYTVPAELADWLKVEGLILDAKAWTVTLEGKAIYLTRKEFDLLLKFLRRRGHILHPSFLLESVWGHTNDTDDFRTVRVHVSTLRKKIGRLGKKIINVPGVGYKFDL